MRPATTIAFILSLYLAACQPQPLPVSGGERSAWSGRLAPIGAYEVVVLNPEEAQDSTVIRRALEREHLDSLWHSFQWLPTDPPRGKRGYGDLAEQADVAMTRRQLRSCLKLSAVSTDTSRVQVLVVRVRVSSRGVVLQAGVEASTVASTDVMVCMMQNVVGWRFRAASEDETFDIPLILIPTPQ